MSFDIKYTGRFRKDLKRLKRRSEGRFKLLEDFIGYLQNVGFDGIDMQYYPHKLKGTYEDCYECHVKSDLLLIWREDRNTIQLIRTGTHSDLF